MEARGVGITHLKHSKHFSRAFLSMGQSALHMYQTCLAPRVFRLSIISGTIVLRRPRSGGKEGKGVGGGKGGEGDGGRGWRKGKAYNRKSRLGDQGDCVIQS